VPLGAVTAPSYCGEVSLAGTLIINMYITDRKMYILHESTYMRA